MRPDPEQIKALQDLPPPKNNKEQQRTIGLFAYYAQWIFQYSDKIKPLLSNCFRVYQTTIPHIKV